MQRERAASKRVGRRGSRAETLSNSLNVDRVPGSDAVKESLREISKTLQVSPSFIGGNVPRRRIVQCMLHNIMKSDFF